ncbi:MULTISPECIES: hypothetical protein [unclassified Pseudoalteromonas]|uniref:hypothetical protein n=1 Tax=unclassified Pseudoalteromonas TaxID=194690 RepID=UPI0005A6D856|nr:MULTISPECIES: hypothetical protein [unclassified Pseudoalteromonas]
MSYQVPHLSLGATWHHSKTNSSGTPALPMDIDFIESNRYNHDGEYETALLKFKWQLGLQDATHAMDNFSQRENTDPDKYRYNTAEAKTLDYKFEVISDVLSFGIEGFSAEHNSTITNPENMMLSAQWQ